jgi:hypothetical protein
VGVLLILIGLIPAGVLADYLVENHVASAPTQSLMLFKRTLTLSQPELVAVGFVLGVAALAFILLGVGLIRDSWGKRQGLKQQVADLQAENTKLRAREHLNDELKWSAEQSAEA